MKKYGGKLQHARPLGEGRRINKTHTDILQKDNIQEDNLKEDYLKEDYLHEPQAMGRVTLRKKVTFGGVQKKTFRKS